MQRRQPSVQLGIHASFAQATRANQRQQVHQQGHQPMQYIYETEISYAVALER